MKTNIRYFLSIPIKTYLVLSFLTVATMGLGNASVGYLNYPTQVMFKCKLILMLDLLYSKIHFNLSLIRL
jgi:hypothetical protein